MAAEDKVSPRPWRFEATVMEERILDANGRSVHVDADYHPSGLSTADGRHIVDAVNVYHAVQSMDLEAFAIRAALGNNGGAWAEHYTEAQKEHWRAFVRDLAMKVADTIKQQPLISIDVSQLLQHPVAPGRLMEMP
jgi:hypothetical protein